LTAGFKWIPRTTKGGLGGPRKYDLFICLHNFSNSNTTYYEGKNIRYSKNIALIYEDSNEHVTSTVPKKVILAMLADLIKKIRAFYRMRAFGRNTNGQCFGSGSALDPHSMGSWIRIRIVNENPDPDPEE
jgi:hypothetical protein